jgi:hypothetical protein
MRFNNEGEGHGNLPPIPLFAKYGKEVSDAEDLFIAPYTDKDDAKCEFAGAGADVILTVKQEFNVTLFMVLIGDLWFFAHTDGKHCVIAKQYGYEARSGTIAYEMREHDVMVRALEVGCEAITSLTARLLRARKELVEKGVGAP